MAIAKGFERWRHAPANLEPPSLPGSPGAGTLDDEVVARDVREAAEVDRIVEAVAAGGEALVAAGGDGEGVADRDRLRHRLPQLDQHAVAVDAMRLHLDREAGIGAAR